MMYTSGAYLALAISALAAPSLVAAAPIADGKIEGTAKAPGADVHVCIIFGNGHCEKWSDDAGQSHPYGNPGYDGGHNNGDGAHSGAPSAPASEHDHSGAPQPYVAPEAPATPAPAHEAPATPAPAHEAPAPAHEAPAPAAPTTPDAPAAQAPAAPQAPAQEAPAPAHEAPAAPAPYTAPEQPATPAVATPEPHTAPKDENKDHDHKNNDHKDDEHKNDGHNEGYKPANSDNCPRTKSSKDIMTEFYNTIGLSALIDISLGGKSHKARSTSNHDLVQDIRTIESYMKAVDEKTVTEKESQKARGCLSHFKDFDDDEIKGIIREAHPDYSDEKIASIQVFISLKIASRKRSNCSKCDMPLIPDLLRVRFIAFLTSKHLECRQSDFNIIFVKLDAELEVKVKHVAELEVKAGKREIEAEVEVGAHEIEVEIEASKKKNHYGSVPY